MPTPQAGGRCTSIDFTKIKHCKEESAQEELKKELSAF
jgi:hypothetical protein